MGHEFSARLLQDVAEKELRQGDVVMVNPIVSCGQCRACLAGNRQQCGSRKIVWVDFPGSFGKRVELPANQRHRVNDLLSGALAEPLAGAVRAGFG